MRKQITISLALIGTVLAVAITIPALLFKGVKADPGGFVFPVQIAPFTPTPSPADNQSLAAFTATTDSSLSKNCTYTDYFWKEHPETWPDKVQIAGITITKDQAASFMQSPDKDISVDLQRVLYVTLLNIQTGADQGSIEKTIQEASGWLAANPPGTPLSEFNQSIAASFIQDLEDYNNGLIGPKICPNQPPTPKPDGTELNTLLTPVDTPTPAPTLRLRRPTVTPKLMATPTPTPIHMPISLLPNSTP